MKQTLPPLADYYRQERAYLREAGRQFAQQYPKLARRLDWNGDDTQDPHVERLLESFAFLTARIQRQTDDLFPEVARSLMNVLYPPLTQPTPPMSVAEFQLNPSADAWKDAVSVPVGTSLLAYAQEGQACTFKTLYPLEMWPLKVLHLDHVAREDYPKLSSRFQGQRLLRVRLESLVGPLSACPLSQLRFYLGGTEHEAGLLYHAFFSRKAPVAWHWDGVCVEQDTFEPMGFSGSEACLPYPDTLHPGFRLLHEFFYCPEKFLFGTLSTQGMKGFYTHVDVLIGIPDDCPVDRLPHGPSQMRLWCTPIINFFSSTTEPFRLTHQHNAIFLCPDQTREATTEIHSVQEVFRLEDQTSKPQRIPRYFSWTEQDEESPSSLFWHGQHKGSKNFPGTDYQLHFVDLDLKPHVPYEDVIFAKIGCTNRDLAQHIPVGGILEAEVQMPTSQIVCLKRPGTTVPPPEDGVILWTLIRHLSAHRVVPQEHQALWDQTHHILHLYRRLSGREHLYADVIEALGSLQASRVMRPLRHEAWRGFIQAQHIDIHLDPRKSPYAVLLGQILAHFWVQHQDVKSLITCALQDHLSSDPWVNWAPSFVAA